MMKEQTVNLDNGITQKLEKFLRTVVRKLKNVWRHEAVHSGIQFFTELDD
jgi:hypothetical protein